MHTAVAMEQISKYVSTETNIRNNRKAVFSVLRGYKKDKEDCLDQLSFETVACQDMSFGVEELN
jgi:hypothetical protein